MSLGLGQLKPLPLGNPSTGHPTISAESPRTVCILSRATKGYLPQRASVGRRLKCIHYKLPALQTIRTVLRSLTRLQCLCFFRSFRFVLHSQPSVRAASNCRRDSRLQLVLPTSASCYVNKVTVDFQSVCIGNRQSTARQARATRPAFSHKTCRCTVNKAGPESHSYLASWPWDIT